MKVTETQRATIDEKEVVEAIKMWMLSKGYEARSVSLVVEAYYSEGFDDRGPPGHRCAGAMLDVIKLKEPHK